MYTYNIFSSKMNILDILEENPFVFCYLRKEIQEDYKKDLEERLVNNRANDQLIYLDPKQTYDDTEELISVIVEYPILFEHIEEGIKTKDFCLEVIKNLDKYDEVLDDLHKFIIDFIPHHLLNEDSCLSRYLLQIIAVSIVKFKKMDNIKNEDISKCMNELCSRKPVQNFVFRERLFLFFGCFL